MLRKITKMSFDQLDLPNVTLSPWNGASTIGCVNKWYNDTCQEYLMSLSPAH
ncbi:hypothetical protein Hdeb2414_s0004g00143241 [Helianthus debilis subsp. tardiflorus]